MTTYQENVGYLLEYEKNKKNDFLNYWKIKKSKINFELLEKEKIKKWIIEFLDVSTSEVCQQMTTY